jgi:hypothetical protein
MVLLAIASSSPSLLKQIDVIKRRGGMKQAETKEISLIVEIEGYKATAHHIQVYGNRLWRLGI